MSIVEPARHRRTMAVTAGVMAGTLFGAVFSAQAATRSDPSPAPVVAAADAPPTVAGISKMLDAFETGASAGPGVVNGVLATVIGSQAFPPPADQVQSAVIQGLVEVGAQTTSQGKAGVAAMREAIAPLSCANPAINQGIEVFAEGFDALAATGEVIAPFDRTSAEMAVLLRSFKAPETAC